MSWEHLLAIAQQVMGQYQQRSTILKSERLYEETAAMDLIAVARVVEAVASKAIEEPSSIDTAASDARSENVKRQQRLLWILSSCAYAMYANYPSSAAIQRAVDVSEIRSEGEWLAIATCNPRRIADALSSAYIGAEARKYLEVLNEFLLRGGEQERRQLIPMFERLMVTSRPNSEIVFMRCARLSLAHMCNLAISRVKRLAKFEGLSEFIDRVVEDQRFCFLPPQFNIINNGLLDRGVRNEIITIPTSTGKTLLAEFSIFRSVASGPGLAVYVVPYVALGNQVFDALKQHAPSNVRVHGLFGGFKGEVTLAPHLTGEVVVATPERFDALLRSLPLLSSLRIVVFDEAHSIESGARGARIESLITRLRLQQHQGLQFKIVLLSAVLGEISTVQNWLGAGSQNFTDGWRPTARRVAIWDHSGHLAWMYSNDPLRPRDKQGTQVLGSKPLPWPETMYATGDFGPMKAQKISAYKNVAYLSRYLASSLGAPILIVCGTRASTRGLASVLAEGLPTVGEQHDAIDVLSEGVEAEARHLRPLVRMARRGVVYHNASIPPRIRRLIELAIKARAIKFVCATTTLAEGVDLPFRITVLLDWLLGFKDNQAPMGTLLFRNIAGRCGRAGEFTQGDTIIFDNLLGDLRYTHSSRRRRYQEALFSDPPELESAIANDNLAAEEREAVFASVSSQFLAAIPENPEDAQLEEKFAESLYARFKGRDVSRLLRSIRDDLLSDEVGEPFAIAASPMRLTAHGRAANRTGFSPASCRKILSFLSERPDPASQGKLASALLMAMGDCAEQQNRALRAMALGRRSTFFVKPADIATLSDGWLSGRPLPDLFGSLPKAQESKAAVAPSQWLRGQAQSDFVAEQYDKFIDFMEHSFVGFLPWLLRACEPLGQVIGNWAAAYKWKELARSFEAARNADLFAVDIQDVSE